MTTRRQNGPSSFFIQCNKIIEARSTIIDFIAGDKEKEIRFKQLIERLDYLERKRSAIKLLRLGIKISDIEEATGLSKNEILKIRGELYPFVDGDVPKSLSERE